MRHADGHARSRSGHAVDARPVLGVPSLRPAFLDDVPAAEAESGDRTRETGAGACIMTPSYHFDDDDLDDSDEDDDFEDEDDESDDEEDEDDEETETWQVSIRSEFR
jgi:hypothetical protein